jgi:hypothetical protein
MKLRNVLSLRRAERVPGGNRVVLLAAPAFTCLIIPVFCQLCNIYMPRPHGSNGVDERMASFILIFHDRAHGGFG